MYLYAEGDDLGAIMGNLIDKSYKLMVWVKLDALLLLGDIYFYLSVIGAKRPHIPFFHMEVGNRCKEVCLTEEINRRIVNIISDVNLTYSEHVSRYLSDCRPSKGRIYVIGFPMAEVLQNNLE